MKKDTCYACGPNAPCIHGVPIPRPRKSKGGLGGDYRGSSPVPSALMTDQEAARVVFQPLPTVYVVDGGRSSHYIRNAKRWLDGSLMIRSDGSGQPHGPKVESIDGDPLARYLALVPNASAGALYGRDWKTGKVAKKEAA